MQVPKVLQIDEEGVTWLHDPQETYESFVVLTDL
jgi:hypothetical protein